MAQNSGMVVGILLGMVVALAAAFGGCVCLVVKCFRPIQNKEHTLVWDVRK
jgi:hypothetical protein